MKYDIRLLKLRDEVVGDEVLVNRATYSTDQVFAMGGDLVPLVQAFLYNLLVDGSATRFSPERAGGLITLARRYHRVSDELEGKIRDAIARVELFMQNEQRGRKMEPQERLRRAHLVSVKPGSTSDEVAIEILLEAESGDVLNLTL